MTEEFKIVEALEKLAVQTIECRICTHRWEAAVCIARDAADLECPNCGNLAGEACDI